MSKVFYLAAFLCFVSAAALAQTDPAGSLSIGDHQHGTSQLQEQIDALEGLLDDHLATHTPPPEPPVEPPVEPPAGDFSELCAQPGVVMCQAFDTDTSNASFNNNPESPSNPLGIAVDNAMFAEGGGSLRLTIDGSATQELSGTIGYQWPESLASGTYYTAWKMRFGDGLQTLLRRQLWLGGGGGIKYMQIVAGAQSCSAEEIVFYDGKYNTTSTGVPQLVYSCSGLIVDGGTYDYQPGGGDPSCRVNYILDVRNSGGIAGNPPCHVFDDDTWHQVEMEVIIGSGYRVWIDGVLAIDDHVSRPPSGPYARSYMGNYVTGYGLWGHPMAGDGTFGNGLWRVYYDNLIVSRDCIFNC